MSAGRTPRTCFLTPLPLTVQQRALAPWPSSVPRISATDWLDCPAWGMDDAEAGAAFSEERRKALEDVVDHDESERLGSESVFFMCRA